MNKIKTNLFSFSFIWCKNSQNHHTFDIDIYVCDLLSKIAHGNSGEKSGENSETVLKVLAHHIARA